MAKQTKSDAEIDEIVDEIVRDEKTATALKDKLHHKRDAASLEEAPHFSGLDNGDDDTDDMWDNMPV